MVNFDPDITEIIFFDLEWYVPPNQRKLRGASLAMNPHKPGQFLLGGVFGKYHPLKQKKEDIKFDHFWLWQHEDNEEILVKNIYEYIKEEWRKFDSTPGSQADLILCGQGISRLDIPVLYIRSTHYGVDNPEEIFYTYCKTKQVDLSNVSIPLIYGDVMYPSNWNQICGRFRFDRIKESGTSVWTYYDNKEYSTIEKRTEAEVLDCVNYYHYIQNKYMVDKRKQRR
jgi:hypothetical protein